MHVAAGKRGVIKPGACVEEEKKASPILEIACWHRTRDEGVARFARVASLGYHIADHFGMDKG